MKSEANIKRSEAMKQIWENDRERMMTPREVNAKVVREAKSRWMKQHFLDHPEHRTSISVAQKSKWVKYKRALKYCVDAGINLE